MKSTLKHHRKLSIESLEDRRLLAIDITVEPFSHEQPFVGGGAGFTLYGGHLVNGVPAAQRPQVYDWLFRDLNLPELRIFSFRGEAIGNDNDDPFDLDLEAFDIPRRDLDFEIYSQAKSRDPNVIVMSYANRLPEYLLDADGKRDLSIPDFHLESAEWLYANLAMTKQRYGIDIEIVDVLNEPDIQDVTQAVAAEVFAETVSALRNLVDLHFDEYGVEMPKISGPSGLNPGAMRNWLTDWSVNEPEAWDNIDYFAVHPYFNGYNAQAYREIGELRDEEHPLFIQNEMEFGHRAFINNGDPYPSDDLEDDLEGALALAGIFTLAVDEGANGFHVFQGVNPSSAGAKSLIRTPWGQTATRRIGYYAYRQLGSLQPSGSDVVTDVTVGAPAGVYTVAFNQWGDHQVFVSVTNANPDATEVTTLKFRDSKGQLIPFTGVTDYETGATKRMHVNEQTNFAQPVTEWSTTVQPNSVRTFVVDLTSFGIPASEATYLRERPGYADRIQDGDNDPNRELLMGFNGNGAQGNGLGIMRGLLEFDLAAADIPAHKSIKSAELTLTAYRGNLGPGDAAQFLLHEFPTEFVAASATWNDPDGDGDANTGDVSPGGSLGELLASSVAISGAESDYDANGRDEEFRLPVSFDSAGMVETLNSGLDSRVRFAIDPFDRNPSPGRFLGFFADDAILPAAKPHIVVTLEANIDFNQDGAVNLPDLDLLVGAVLNDRHPAEFDLTGDRLVTDEDVTRWLLLAGEANLGAGVSYLRGDANLDGVVDVSDFNVWNASKFSALGLWSTADFNVDGVVDISDFNIWNANKFRTAGRSPGASARGGSFALLRIAENDPEEHERTRIWDVIFT